MVAVEYGSRCMDGRVGIGARSAVLSVIAITWLSLKGTRDRLNRTSAKRRFVEGLEWEKTHKDIGGVGRV